MSKKRDHKAPYLAIAESRESLECSVLGACLLSPAAIDECAKHVGENSFESSLARSIWAVIISLHQDGKPVDPVTVIESLITDGSAAPDASTYVAGLASSVPSSSSAGHYAVMLRERVDRERASARMAELSEKLNQGTISLEATQLALQDIEFGATAKPRPKAIPVSAFESERVEWIWTGRLPRGKVTILDGDPGLGKSTISLDIAAKVSRGHSFPNDIQRGQPGTALLLSAEDGIGDTIRPRLEAAGADIDKIHLLRGIPEKGDSERPVVVPNDLPLIETIIAEIGAELVILDPLMAFLGAKVDSHRDQDVRRAMHALASVAERTGAALLIIRHLNKSGGQNAVHRGGGSIGIIGSARLGLIVGKDPDNNDQRVLAITKSNIAIEAQSLAYKIVEDDTLKVAKIEWLGTTGHRANDLLNDPNPCERPAQNEAEEVLRSILQAGPLPAKEVKRLANDAGISKRTIDRAKASLKIRSVKTGAPGSAVQVWKWELPEDRPEPPNTNTVAIFSEAWRSSEEYEGISASESEDGSESGQASERENTQIL